MRYIKKISGKNNRRSFIKTIGAGGLGLGLGSMANASNKSANIYSGDTLTREYVKIFHNPDRELLVDSPGIVKLPDEVLLATVPVRPTSKKQEERESITYIFRSKDRGQNWQMISELKGYFSVAPWIYKDTLYLFANPDGTKPRSRPYYSRYRNDDLLLLRSDNGGMTWSEPVILFKGHFWNCPTGMVIKNNKLYWAVDDLALPERNPRAVVCDLSLDIMNSASWRISDTIPFVGVPKELINPKFAGDRDTYILEPNVIDVQGQLRVICCVKPAKQTTSGLSAVYDLTDNKEKLDLKFTQFHPLPGGQLKFHIIKDEKTQLFWMTANLVVDSHDAFDWWEKADWRGGNDRRFLMLFYGLDGLNWFQAGCIAYTKNINQSYMYATPVIDGDDLAVISRSSINSGHQHDADFATFHRVQNFRSLAKLKLVPDL
ncbi:MAG: sialidase family protein [Bacteroidota bacterium]